MHIFSMLDNPSAISIDWQRVGAFGSTSLILAPTVHYWYIFLDSVKAGSRALLMCKKLAFDAVIFSPLYILLFYCFQSVFERRHYTECLQKLHTNGPVLWVTESITWIPIQLVNFRFVPLTYRVLYDNAVSFCFDTLYSSVYHAEDILPIHY